MKSNVNSKIIILIALGILFALSPIITSNFIFNVGNNKTSSEYDDDITVDYENLKISATSGKIHIDGNSEWVAFKNAGKCTGEGTYSDPYIIEDLVIDAGGWGSCILIENSDVYFKIENCYVYNAGGSYEETYAGIQLSNVNNALIISNNCPSNELGIILVYSNNNTISGNNVSNNDCGISLRYSNNNTISNNNGDGIYLYHSDNSTILNNNGCRITLSYSNNSTLSGNTMNYCGISLSGSLAEVASHIIDDTNLVNYKPVYYYVNELGLGSSNFTNAGQIILVNCNDSIISNLTVSYGTTGIALLYCNKNTISGNTVNNNLHYGIELTHSDNNTISGNTVNNNLKGIDLFHSDYNTISGNTANNNKYDGITLYYSDNNTISNNNGGGIDLLCSNNNTISGNIAYNSWGGIYLSHSDYNTISGNTANNNKFEGIKLYYSDNNTISGNTANNNKFEGIYLSYSNYNTISENNASNNECGIYLSHSDYNNISENNASNNEYGIYLSHSDYNTISGNTLLGNDECCVEENCQGNMFSDNGSCICVEVDGISLELIILISSISGGAVIGVATLLLIKRKRKRIE